MFSVHIRRAASANRAYVEHPFGFGIALPPALLQIRADGLGAET